MFRKQQLKTATVKRLSYTGTTYKKSSYVVISASYNGHLKALTVKDGIAMEAFGKEFKFTTNIGANILQGDKLTIDGVEYNVTGVQDFRGLTFNTKQILLSKEV